MEKFKQRLENKLLSLQVLKQQIENQAILSNPIHPQLSIHILQTRKLPIQFKPKITRYLELFTDDFRASSKPITLKGNAQSMSVDESFLISLKSINSQLTIVLHETSSLGEKVIGGVVIKTIGFQDQTRHDGWYDIGCGEIRLAIRLIYDLTKFYNNLSSVLQEKILKGSKQRYQKTFVKKIVLQAGRFLLKKIQENKQKRRFVQIDELIQLTQKQYQQRKIQEELVVIEEGQFKLPSQERVNFRKPKRISTIEKLKHKRLNRQNSKSSLRSDNASPGKNDTPYLQVERTFRRRQVVKK